MGKQSSNFKRSTGNVVAQSTGGGVVTAQVQGKAYFQSFGMNVMIDGEPAVRHLDLVTHNQAGQAPPNTPPKPWLATMNVPAPQPESATKDGQKAAGWIAITLKDSPGKPEAGVRYQVQLPDESTLEGVTPVNGVVDVIGIPEGKCNLKLPDIDPRNV